MSVTRALALRAAVQQLLNTQVPLVTPQDEHDRVFALADALSYELATHLLTKHPGVELPREYVVDRVVSFCAEMLLPFTACAVRELAGQKPEQRH